VALLLEQSIGQLDDEELKQSDDHQRRSLQLKFLTLIRCDRLRRLGPPSMSFENLRLVAVVAMVTNCPEMMSFSGQATSTPKLKRIHIMNTGVGDTSSGDEGYDVKLEDDDHDTISDSSDFDRGSKIKVWRGTTLIEGDLNATIREFRRRPDHYRDMDSVCALS
ncbi:hypothetical protein TorRG33x02_029550, partial [Trema orientale]